MIFYGSTKKVAYEAHLTGDRLVPIQAITCILHTAGALIGSYLFFIGLFTQALLFTITLTQIWWVLSETRRADFRGFGKVSAYQKMGVIGVLSMMAVMFFLPAPQSASPMCLWACILFGIQPLF